MDVTEQRDYFNGMLAFHEGHFEEARKRFSAALNTQDTALTSEQKIEAFRNSEAQCTYRRRVRRLRPDV
jgi:hypothetical protein